MDDHDLNPHRFRVINRDRDCEELPEKADISTAARARETV